MNTTQPEAGQKTREESVELHCQEGGADKIYQVKLIAKEGGYILHAANGRRGGTLTPQVKIANPVPYETAKKAFDKLISEKFKKHYKPTGKTSASFVAPEKREDSGIRTQQLDEIGEERALQLLTAPRWCVQEKHDGKRIVLTIKDGKATGSNKQGLTCGIPESVQIAAGNFPCDAIIDGEMVGDTYHAFDILEKNGKDARHGSYSTRFELLEEILNSRKPLDKTDKSILLVSNITDPEERKEYFQELLDANREGIVFKQTSAAFTPGKGHGTQLKYKFYDTASVIVTQANQKRSVGIAVIDATGTTVPVGNVTIPANHNVPKTGDVVEVRYLYAFQGGSLFQPTYLGLRDDTPKEECLISQLKYKAA